MIIFEFFLFGMVLGGFSMFYLVVYWFLVNVLGFEINFGLDLSSFGFDMVGFEFIYVYGLFSFLIVSFVEEIIYCGYVMEWLFCL